MKRVARRPHVAKTRSWKLASFLSLGLGVLGAVGVIELRPQISVSPQEPIEKSQPFSVPFQIENTGYFPFWLQRPFCFLNEAHDSGNWSASHFTAHQPWWNRHIIDRGEAETIVCGFLHTTPALSTTNADIAVVVDYRPWRFFPWTFRRYFRFQGQYIDNWQWTKQPSDPIQDAADNEISAHMKEHPESR